MKGNGATGGNGGARWVGDRMLSHGASLPPMAGAEFPGRMLQDGTLVPGNPIAASAAVAQARGASRDQGGGWVSPPALIPPLGSGRGAMRPDVTQRGARVTGHVPTANAMGSGGAGSVRGAPRNGRGAVSLEEEAARTMAALAGVNSPGRSLPAGGAGARSAGAQSNSPASKKRRSKGPGKRTDKTEKAARAEASIDGKGGRVEKGGKDKAARGGAKAGSPKSARAEKGTKAEKSTARASKTKAEKPEKPPRAPKGGKPKRNDKTIAVDKGIKVNHKLSATSEPVSKAERSQKGGKATKVEKSVNGAVSTTEPAALPLLTEAKSSKKKAQPTGRSRKKVDVHVDECAPSGDKGGTAGASGKTPKTAGAGFQGSAGALAAAKVAGAVAAAIDLPGDVSGAKRKAKATMPVRRQKKGKVRGGVVDLFLPPCLRRSILFSFFFSRKHVPPQSHK